MSKIWVITLISLFEYRLSGETRLRSLLILDVHVEYEIEEVHLERSMISGDTTAS